MRTLETQFPNFFISFQTSCYISSFIIIYINLALIFWGLLVLSSAKCFNKLLTCRVRKWITFHVHSNIFVKSLIIDEAITRSHARIKVTYSVWISEHACKNIQTPIFANELEKQYRTLKNTIHRLLFSC